MDSIDQNHLSWKNLSLYWDHRLLIADFGNWAQFEILHLRLLMKLSRLRLPGSSQEKNHDRLHLISIRSRCQGDTAEILKRLHLLFFFPMGNRVSVCLWGYVSSREQKFMLGFPLWENHVCVFWIYFTDCWRRDVCASNQSCLDIHSPSGSLISCVL